MELQELIDAWGEDRARLWAIINSEDSPESFAAFYATIYHRPLPDHAYYEWILPLYLVRADFAQRDKYLGQFEAYWENFGLNPPTVDTNQIGVVIEAFRTSSKTTTLTNGWTLYRIGKEPHNSNLILRIEDGTAKDSADEVSKVIEDNRGWKIAFPFIEPDEKAGWGANGYEVVRTDMEYETWRRLCTRTKGQDATLLGLGYMSRAVIGKHPTGSLVVDDIHDENNTASERELATAKKIMNGTILPTRTPTTWFTVVGTPWTATDILADLKSTGLFSCAHTPIIRDNKLTWEDERPREMIEEYRKLVGEIEFARMYLCDVTAMEGVNLRREWLHKYPAEKIQPDWPVIMGVDYASTADKLKDKNRDYFTIAVGKAIPGGSGVVLVDGFRGHLSQGEAELKLKEFAGRYPYLQVVGVEAVGKGEEFYNLMLRTSRLPVQAVSPGRRNKGQRFEKGMAPLFQWNRAWLIDTPNSFIDDFTTEWLQWPYGEHDDTLDAVYWMLFVGLPHMMGERFEPGTHDPIEAFRASRPKAENPFEGIGNI